ncbi:23S rRNA pseudouridine(2604) synthase RluF [Marinospirillum sp.]|uniref:23S rRNA pseudouridine(2604) synthase RluF n=1 Tax=Marinospirillum sp. TaxID=2183934 RepID=UPI003A8A506B
MSASQVRLNKWISETGLCSRREADRLIEEGVVKVNGRVADMGVRVSAEDDVRVRGKALRAKPPAVYLAYNKPVGITCTTDPEVPENIVDAVGYKKGRIFPIGRLDKPSEGLIFLTNDGDIVNKILRAGNAHEKEYVVEVDRPFDTAFLQRMAAGVPILGQITQPCQIRALGPQRFNIILTQGLNRQIRRMTEFLGYQVTRLKRVRIMNVSLGGLKPGQWRLLNQQEMAQIEQMLHDSSKTEEASQRLDAPQKSASSAAGAQKKARMPVPRGGRQPAARGSSNPSQERGRSQPGVKKSKKGKKRQTSIKRA